MKAKLIKALADVLAVDMGQLKDLTQDEALAMLEDMQANEINALV